MLGSEAQDVSNRAGLLALQQSVRFLSSVAYICQILLNLYWIPTYMLYTVLDEDPALGLA